MLVSPAYAQGVGGGLAGIEPLIPLVLIFVVFYFLLIRPQQKKAKAHREMLTALRRGDRVVTSGGIIGTISRVVSDTELSVEIAENVKVRVARGMIAEVLAKTEPKGAAEEGEEEDEKDKKADAEKRAKG
jgi:preprotein translocase subunit YajC